MAVKEPRIRPIVIGLFIYNGCILVADCYDPVKDQKFYRPLGGAIEFGEYAEDALRREMREELSAEITDLRYLGMMENLFIFDGIPGHEIVLVYDAAFTDSRCYNETNFIGDEGGTPFEARWLPPIAFTSVTPVYPEGLLEFLTEKGILLIESGTRKAETTRP